MEWLWGIIGILVLIIVILLIKIYIMQKSMQEIEEAFADRLMTDTNTLIDISSHDKYVKRLANSINRELRKLRREHHRYVQGDKELKNAVTNIAHDLRTPLTAICGYLDLLEQEKKSDEASRYVAIIKERTEVVKQLTEELFRYSVIMASDGGEKSEVVVNRVLEESVAAFYAVLKEKGIEPEIELPECRVVRELDCSALSRVFGNLLGNAVKYSTGDLEIVLGETGEITFSNSAPELDEVQVGKLFDRFYTVDNAHRSTGLGLSIAKALVEQMGGTIEACYMEGKLRVRLCL